VRRSWALPLIIATSGCSVSLADSAEQDRDSVEQLCETDEDCGEEATCFEGTCVGGNTIFDTVLVEIAVPNAPAAGAYGGTRYLRTLSGLPSDGGRLDLDLSPSTVVKLEVSAPPCEDATGERVAREGGACPAETTSLRSCTFDLAATPLEVTLTPIAWTQGLSTLRYSTISECSDDDCAAVDLQLSVPPGEYDVYLRQDPAAEPPEGICPIVPEIFSLDVPADVQLAVDYELTPASRLDVEVRWPLEGNHSADLEEWMIDMLDPRSGRRVSTTVVLGPATVDSGVATYTAEIDYVPTADVLSGSELVRMRPPEDEIAPTIVMERSALELFRGPAVVDQFTSLPDHVEVDGLILARTSADDPGQLHSVGGTVTLVATALEGLPPGVLASYRVTVQAEDDGSFTALLLPGTYRARVVPPSDCSDVIACAPDELVCECPLAATEVTDFVVAVQPYLQAGKTVELEWQARLAGQVSTAAGSPAVGADVLAISVPQRPTALEVALGLEAFVPRASSGQSDASGRFELFADPGSFNVSVRPDSGLGLAWLVRPNVSVSSGSGSLELVLPLPVSYSGEVRVAGATGDDHAIVPNATIRAYVPIDAETNGAVVQVAEAESNEAGEFQLLLPTSLEHDR
jgi:hypothetical protein